MPPFLKRFFWTAHRWVGLTAGTIFVLTATTGAIMMFQRDFNLEGAPPLAAEATSLAGLNAGVARVQESYPDMAPRFLLPPTDRSHGWQVFISPRSGDILPHRLIGIDPATGALLSDVNYDRTPKGWLLDLHHSLVSGPIGTAVMLVVSACLIFISISGFIIVTRRWRTLRNNPLKAKGNRWRAVHRWAGVAGGVFILIWGTTGFMLLLPSVLAEMQGQFKLPPVVPIPFDVSLESVVTRDAVTREGELFTVGLPTERSPQITLTMLRRDALPWNKMLLLQVDTKSGEVTKRILPQDQPSAGRWTIAERAIHQGLYESRPLHIAYMILTLFPLMLVVTGPVTWLRRSLSRRFNRLGAKPSVGLKPSVKV